MTNRERKIYYSLHKWLNKTYGKADHCENPDCEGKSKTYEWALIHGKEYDYKREHFMQLCISCHRRYDFSISDYKMTEQHKSNIGKANIGRRLSEEHKSNIGRANIGRIVSKETRQKISEKNKGKILSAEAKRKVGDASRGRLHSDEVRKKIGDSLRGIKKGPMSEEHKENIRKAIRKNKLLKYGK